MSATQAVRRASAVLSTVPTAAEAGLPELAPGEQRLTLHPVSWRQYEALRRTLDDHPGLRMTYLEGVLEIVSPSQEHEAAKTTLGRLIELYALERGLDLNGYGSTTFRKRTRRRGVEPDECYCVGELKKVPDIAIEVIVSRGSLDRLEVYRGLGVPEVWFWRKGTIAVHRLVGTRYRRVERSAFLPDLDLGELATYVVRGSQSAAVRAWRDVLRR